MKLHRLLAIVMLLLSRKRINGQELADQFEVSLRTIYRDLETINSAGIPIVSYTGADGGYEVMEQYRIDKQIVSVDELHSIVVALKGMKASFDDRETDTLLAKVGALVAKTEQNRKEESGETLIYDMVPWRGKQENKTILTLLRQAAKTRNVVRFTYTNAEGSGADRSVEPVGLAWKGYAWYLYAYCRLRGDYRTFRLSRIRELHVEPEQFPRRDVRLEELDAKFGKRDDAPLVDMVLRVHSRVRVRAEEFFGADHIASGPDDYLTISVKYPDSSWLYGMLLSFGQDVKVLEPPYIAHAIREQAERIAGLYKEA